MSRSKSIARSFVAVVAGFVFIAVTHTVTDKILETAGVLPTGNLWVGPGLVILVLGYRAVLSLIGCYITARLAPSKPLKHALILGVVGVVLSTLGAIANAQMNLGPDWYVWTLVAMSLPIAWLGGRWAEKK